MSSPSDWTEGPLGSFVGFLSGGTPSRAESRYWNGDIPWITAKDMKRFLLFDSEDHLTAAGAQCGTRVVPEGTTLMLVRGMTLHKDLPICVVGRAAAFNQDVKAVQPRPGTLLDYVPYLLLGNKRRLLDRVDSAGHGTGRLNNESLASLEVSLPGEGEQSSIAATLGAIDRKLELNRRMAETLRELARVAFQMAFDHGPQDEQLPPGWSVSTLGEMCEVVDCRHSRKPSRQSVGRPLLQLNNIREDGLLDMSDTYLITDPDYEFWTGRIELRGGDCVITNVGRVGAVAQVPPSIQAALGRNMTGIRVRVDWPYPTFLIELLLSEAMRAEISLRTDTGTILDALNVRSIPHLRFALPPMQELEQFERNLRPVRARMEQLLDESHALSDLREALLPGLVSGELRLRHRRGGAA